MCHFFFSYSFFFLCFYAIWEQIDGKRGKIRVWFWMTNASRRHWLKSQHMSRLSQSHATSMIHCPITLCYWFLVQCRFEGGVTQPENGEFFFLHLGRTSLRWVADERVNFFVHLMRSVTPAVSLYELQRAKVCARQRGGVISPGSDHVWAVTTL